MVERSHSMLDSVTMMKNTPINAKIFYTLISSFLFSSSLLAQTVTTLDANTLIYNSASNPPLNHQIKVESYNLENLFEKVDPAQSALIHQKRLGSARVIKSFNPDFLVTVEIENIRALQNYSDTYLDGKYQALLIEGNDPRGIDVGLLVKKSLNVYVEWKSQKDTVFHAKKIFSRDFPIGLVYEKNANGSHSTKPLFAIIATHYKSKRMEPGSSDIDGNGLRAEQVQASVEILKGLEKQYQNSLPLIIAGDFNDTISDNSPIFKPLFDFGMKDSLKIAPNPSQTPLKIQTQFYFNREGVAQFQQIDAILFNGIGAKVVQSKVLENLDTNLKQLPHPATFEERERLPSDHLSIGTIFQF